MFSYMRLHMGRINFLIYAAVSSSSTIIDHNGSQSCPKLVRQRLFYVVERCIGGPVRDELALHLRVNCSLCCALQGSTCFAADNLQESSSSLIPLSYDSHGHSCCALFVGYAMFGEVAHLAKVLELMLPNSQLGGWVAII